jgi:hypothetical protein
MEFESGEVSRRQNRAAGDLLELRALNERAVPRFLEFTNAQPLHSRTPCRFEGVVDEFKVLEL